MLPYQFLRAGLAFSNIRWQAQGLNNNSLNRMLAAYLNQSTTEIIRVYKRSINNHCIYCLTPSPQCICPSCLDMLPTLTLHCPRCAEPNAHGLTCGECLRHPPAFDAVCCPYLFKGPVIPIIHSLKRTSKVKGLKDVQTQLLQQLEQYQLDAIIPMPYHWRKLLTRGHSPTLTISRYLAHHLGLPVIHSIKRVKATTSQQNLDKPARQRNMRKAFAPGPAKFSVKGRNVLLVDDVLTTGATAHAAALELKRMGAKSVILGCLARTPLTDKPR